VKIFTNGGAEMTAKTEPINFELQLFWSARKNLYQFIRLLFSEPNMELLKEISQIGKLDELAKLHEGGKILRSFFDQLTTNKIGKEIKEYQRLFIGPGPVAAPPWESYYRSREHLLFEEWTYQVRNFYHHNGLQYIKENNEPDDHLLLELEFIEILTDLSSSESNVENVIELLSTAIDFLKNHLMVWIPYFCERVIEATNSPLYLGAAMLLEDFLNDDLISLSEVREALANV
jgi:putative dimethyl sulfoxide reductase chaperone